MGAGAPRHLSAGTRAKAPRLQETTELGSRLWQQVGAGWHPQEEESSRCRGAGMRQASGMMNGPTRGLSSPQASPQRPWPRHWMWTEGPQRKRGGCSQSPLTPTLCALRKGPWGRGPRDLGFGLSLVLDLLSEGAIFPAALGLSFPTGLSLASFPVLASHLGICPPSCLQ